MRGIKTRYDSKECVMAEPFLPVCEPFLDGNERTYVLEALETGWISSAGKYIGAFETAFASYLGAKHAIAVSNGTTALHLALVAMGIGKGDEVIIPDFTMIASAFAVCYTGATPVFVDAERDTGNIDPAQVEARITPRTRAIMPVHIYGHPCAMEAIRDIARRHSLLILEDAAEVHGATYQGTKCGVLGDIAAFSFFANKVATTGEGGMVVTNDDGLAQRCRYFKNLCFPLGAAREYRHDHIGFNYRMSNLHAAIGLAQVEKLESYVALRRANHERYATLLKGTPGLLLQPELGGCRNVYWMNGVVVDPDRFGMTRDALMVRLKEAGIDSRKFFLGMHTQKSLADYGCDCSGSFPVSTWLGENGLYLPSGSNLSPGDIERVASCISELGRA
jgi:perosamine synthetase